MKGSNMRTSFRIFLISCLIIPLFALPAMSEEGWGSQSTGILTSASPEYTVNLPGGWNIFSTPVLLDGSHAAFGEIFAPDQQAKIAVVLGWDGEKWYIPAATDEADPLYAYYIKVDWGSVATATIVPSSQISIPPSRQVQVGLNLIGPAPAYDSAQGNFPPILLTDGLASIKQVGDLPGYTIVISPNLAQPGWVYTGGSAIPDLLTNKGYWVIMENGPDSLFGYSTTPVA